jgi:hypothetical protein
MSIMPKRLLLVLSVILLVSAGLVGQEKSIFGPGKLHRITVTMSKAEWDVLQTSSPRNAGGTPGEDYVQPDGRIVHIGGGFRGYFPWIHADLVVNGTALKDVGMRYKGNNSFASSNAARPFRANFKVKTDLFGGKADWDGAETLNIHAGVVDPTLMREDMSYAIFREAGVPASRTAYAEMTFNVPGLHESAPGGFYVLIENVNKQFLKRVLPPGTGLLMKPEGVRGGISSLGNNWAAYVASYRPDREATPHEQQRVMEFANLVSQSDTRLFHEKIGSYLDVDAFLRFIAVNVIIQNNDSYLSGNHNYFVYLDPKDDKFRFIPWDMDLAMAGRGAGMDILRPSGANNPLIYKLLDDPGVAERYRAILKEIAASVFITPVLNRLIADAEAVIPNRDPATRTFLINRAAFLESLVASWLR